MSGEITPQQETEVTNTTETSRAGPVTDNTPPADTSPDKIVRVDVTTVLEESEKSLRQEKLILEQSQPLPSTEAFNLFYAGTDFMKKVSGFVSNIVSKIQNTVNQLVEGITEDMAKPNLQGFENLTLFAQSTDYYAISKRFKIFTPAKLKGKWLPYVQFLAKLTAHNSTLDKDLLGPLSAYFAQLINKPELASSNSFKPQYTSKDIEGYQNTLKKFFTAQQSEYVYWGEAFSSNKEYTEVINNLLEAKKNITILSPKTVKSAVDTLMNRANVLAKNFKEVSSAYVLSPKQSKIISDLLYDAARATELYTVGLQLVYELDQCFRNTAKRMRDEAEHV